MVGICCLNKKHINMDIGQAIYREKLNLKMLNSREELAMRVGNVGGGRGYLNIVQLSLLAHILHSPECFDKCWKKGDKTNEKLGVSQ